MNLASLQTFLAIAEAGSLARASEQLHVTQSTVTARLKGLEQELGRPLFDRGKSGARLTQAGIRFKRYAETMTGLWRQARAETARQGGEETLCNLGCHVDLWPDPGRGLFREILRAQPEATLSAWPGSPTDLDRWLSVGLINAALTFQPIAREGQTIRELRTERLVLYTTRPGSPMRFDPLYVYVDAGEEFARQHDAAYADADIARLSFGCAAWAIEHLLEYGGSAYLPERLARPHLQVGALHLVPGAPDFSRKVFLITNDAAAAAWDWLPAAVDRVAAG